MSRGPPRRLVVVNLSGAPAHARAQLPWSDLVGRPWTLRDALDGQVFERAGDELASEGLYVGLEPWGRHFLAMNSARLRSVGQAPGSFFFRERLSLCARHGYRTRT